MQNELYAMPAKEQFPRVTRHWLRRIGLAPDEIQINASMQPERNSVPLGGNSSRRGRFGKAAGQGGHTP
jgi:hypothetical protein